jgi:hypothetical protein
LTNLLTFTVFWRNMINISPGYSLAVPTDWINFAYFSEKTFLNLSIVSNQFFCLACLVNAFYIRFFLIRKYIWTSKNLKKFSVPTYWQNWIRNFCSFFMLIWWLLVHVWKFDLNLDIDKKSLVLKCFKKLRIFQYWGPLQKNSLKKAC